MKECIAVVQDAVIHMKDDVIIDAVKKCLAEGLSPIQIIEEGLSGGLDVVGQKFEAGEYYLAELIMAGDVVTEATGMLKDKMDPGDMGKKGKVILATVKGDVHDIGKNIVAMILSAQGYEVVDLGVDVASEKIVAAVSETGIQLLGLSILLTTMVPAIKEVVDLLTAKGLRKKVKIAIGGACCSQQLADEMGVDAFGESAVAAVDIFDRFKKELEIA
ncbi:cobalamin B12-binding domain-containing protein [Desulfosudis oleivorans]|uniref:Cobalamin B12-binding domain protein n=1 Tax=Desulfosudis oleivorans (strain DSM 6200 / JCM 39069 / Hxd3) TaxID=96561 RepID=A8ZYY8_DESOH|nr:cobalamin-dependent protein [Desulfosudis oleivorans]ABW68761.1 cobalamin B12-binding domain protein [Desulfosudis oleivorans Hxd3]